MDFTIRHMSLDVHSDSITIGVVGRCGRVTVHDNLERLLRCEDDAER